MERLPQDAYNTRVNSRQTQTADIVDSSDMSQPAPANQVNSATRSNPDLGWRVMSLLNIYRVFVAIVLIVMFSLTREPPIIGAIKPELFLFTVSAYLFAGLASGWTIARRKPDIQLQTAAQLVLDITAIVLLMHTSGGISSGLGNLLIISIGAASLILGARTALSFAAITALAILFEQAVSQFDGVSVAADYTAAGVLGAIIFVIALAAQPLSRRITESEALAEQRGVDLADLAELNEYIVQHLRESIVVIDDTDHVRLMNASAAKYLGVANRTVSGRHLSEMSPELHAITQEWRKDAGEIQANFSPFSPGDGATLITPHFAPLGHSTPAAALIFLEDATQLSERVQQAKLAALGRLSASIAHEIRNPVGAISHAGQLLAESESIQPDERRLTDIIHTQSRRVNSIIENVLQLSRRDNTRPQKIVIRDWLADFVTEFVAGNHLTDAVIPVNHDDDAMTVRFDPSHLHQVLWNLCENAIRYASAADGKPTLSLHCGRLSTSGRPFLEVLDRGPGIQAEMADKIFEPFFTAAHNGTGLGLFIARELCECNNAGLRYQQGPDNGSRFQIIFADPKRWAV